MSVVEVIAKEQNLANSWIHYLLTVNVSLS